jgi:hypothetical protein
MLISQTVLSAENKSLTKEMAAFVLGHIDDMSSDEGSAIISSATSPMLLDDTLFDGLPIDVRARYVMEPFFPRKHFNGTFAYLFGVDSIEDIKPEDIWYFWRTTDISGNEFAGKMKDAVFSQSEYEHFYWAVTAFIKPGDKSFMRRCRKGLMEHELLTEEILKSYLADGVGIGVERFEINPNVSSEVASFYFDLKCKEAEELMSTFMVDHVSNSLVNQLRMEFALTNLSNEKRDQFVSKHGYLKLGLRNLSFIYNDKLSDKTLSKVMANGTLLKDVEDDCHCIISDARVPEGLAADIAMAKPQVFARAYLSRSDVDDNKRMMMLERLCEVAHNKDYNPIRNGANRMACKLIESNTLTLPEVIWMTQKYDHHALKKPVFSWALKHQIDLPRDLQDMLSATGINNSAQAQYFYDVKELIKRLESMHVKNAIDTSNPGLDRSDVLSNPNWTVDTLLELAEAFKQKAALIGKDVYLRNMRNQIYCKLFSEHVFPAALSGQGLEHGAAEKVLASIIEGREFYRWDDIKLAMRLDIDFNYKDDKFDLSAELAKDPQLHEEVVSLQLKKKMDSVAGSSAPAPTKVSRMI